MASQLSVTKYISEILSCVSARENQFKAGATRQEKADAGFIKYRTHTSKTGWI